MIFLVSLLAVQMVTADFSISSDSEEFEIDYSDLDDDDEELEVTHSVVITNGGSSSEDVTLSVAGLNSDYEAELTSSADASFTLASSESRTVSLTITVDVTSGIDEGTQSNVVELEVDGISTQTFNLDADVISMLELDRISFHRNENYESNMDEDDEGDGDPDVEVKPGEMVRMYFSLDNLFDSNYREGDIDGTILVELNDNNFGEDVDEELDYVIDSGEKFDDGGDDSVYLEFLVPLDAEDREYDLDITIEGSDENGADYTIEWSAELEVIREGDDVRVENVTLTPDTVSCLRSVTAKVNIRNYGSDDQNNAAVRITNSQVNIDLDEGFSLDEGFGSDATHTAIFDFSVPSTLAAGSYPLKVETFYDFDKISDQKFVDLVVQSCSTSSSSSTVDSSDDSDTDATVTTTTTTGSTNSITTAAVAEESIVPTVAGSNSNVGVDTVEKVYSYEDVVVALVVALLVLIVAIVVLLLALGFKLASR